VFFSIEMSRIPACRQAGRPLRHFAARSDKMTGIERLKSILEKMIKSGIIK